MPTPVIITLAVVGGLTLLFGLLAMVTKKVRAAGEARIAQRYGSGASLLRTEPDANFFGVQSGGMGQIRGNGALALARNELWFSLYMPQREVLIPLGDVLEATTARSHLGKSVGRKLLLVRFRAAGGEDSVAWAVRDVDGWIAAIDAARA
jgi:hypothetical protein